jgi:hypothetical protein
VSRPRIRAAELLGGPLDGTTYARPAGQGWPLFLDAETGEPLTTWHGARALRAPAPYDGGVYIAESTTVRSPASTTRNSAYVLRNFPVHSPQARYIHTTEHVLRGLAWPLIARALAGTHTGRLLAGGSNDPDDVLDALVGDVDDLIRLRLRRDFPGRRP